MSTEPLDLDAIRARAEDADRCLLFRSTIDSQHDVRPLLAEVERLRAENADMAERLHNSIPSPRGGVS